MQLIRSSIICLIIGTGLAACKVNTNYVQVERGVFDSISNKQVPRPTGDSDKLENGTGTIDSLVIQFVNAVKTNDTTALMNLNLNKSEFNEIYYPGHPQSQPPYDLSPQLMWFRLTANSDKGLRRLLRDYGGNLKMKSFNCHKSIDMGNGNTIHSNCIFSLDSKKDKTTILFSSIIERDGAYKILSYANDL